MSEQSELAIRERSLQQVETAAADRRKPTDAEARVNSLSPSIIHNTFSQTEVSSVRVERFSRQAEERIDSCPWIGLANFLSRAAGQYSAD
jgi:hypothetical protein